MVYKGVVSTIVTLYKHCIKQNTQIKNLFYLVKIIEEKGLHINWEELISLIDGLKDRIKSIQGTLIGLFIFWQVVKETKQDY